MGKKNKEMLMKELGAATYRIEQLEREDKQRRTELTKVLKYQNIYEGIGYRDTSEPMTWLQIAFHIGELRADANYALVVEQVENLKRENHELRKPPAESGPNPIK